MQKSTNNSDIRLIMKKRNPALAPNPLQGVHAPNALQGIQAPSRPEDSSLEILPSTNVTIPPKSLPNGPANLPKPLPNGPADHPKPLPNGPAYTPKVAPNGPAFTPKVMPNGPATHHHNPPRTLEHAPKVMPNGPAHTPISFPNGPGHFDHNNPPTKRDNYRVLCTGTDLTSKIRTCNKGSTDTDLNGYWCGANCKCDKFGNMSCDAKKAPGCSKEVLTSTCGAAVRDWNCACVRA